MLPLRRTFAKAEGEGWLSEAWTFRRERLYLVPGDSPLGLRLPLASLPKVAAKDYPRITPLDPYKPRGALPNFDRLYAKGVGSPPRPNLAAKPPIVRTALSVQARDGALYVFMPPVAQLEDYLELVAHIEAAADGAARADRRLDPARRHPPGGAEGHARPRRDRGQHPAGRDLGRGGEGHHRPI